MNFLPKQKLEFFTQTKTKITPTTLLFSFHISLQLLFFSFKIPSLSNIQVTKILLSTLSLSPLSLKTHASNLKPYCLVAAPIHRSKTATTILPHEYYRFLSSPFVRLFLFFLIGWVFIRFAPSQI
ncbi:hypothetical protein AMTRI_Chr04g246520 [Amborella trichopoda]